MPNQFVARGRQRSVLTRKGSSDARACARFFAWCETRGLTLPTIRNLIAHNDCKKKHFEDRTRQLPPTMAALTVSDSYDGSPYGGKVILSDEWVRSWIVLPLIFDEAAAQKFGLKTLNRMTSFLFRK
jgi:hypothetical protein